MKTASTFASFLSTPRPAVGVEIAPRRVTAVSIASGTDGAVIAAHATEYLPEGTVVPALNAVNLQNPAAVVEAVGAVFDRMGSRPKRVGLVIPDSVAKVSLVRFENVPPRSEDLDQLIRWQVRKAAPFRIEDAQVSYTAGLPTPGGGREFVVVVARTDLVGEYEQVCAAAGAQAGIVDLASFNLINAVLAGGNPGGPSRSDWLLVHVTPEYSTIAIVRGEHLIFFRNRTAEGDENLADLVHQTAMYYEDRLDGAGFTRVILAGAASGLGASGTDDLHRSLEERLATRVEPIDPREAARLTDRISASPDLLDALASPVGLILREFAA